MQAEDAPRLGWDREEIKAALRMRFGSMLQLETSWGYAPGAISLVLGRRNASIPLERLIADAICQHPHTLWPDRWTADGVPLVRSGEPFNGPAGPAFTPKTREKAA